MPNININPENLGPQFSDLDRTFTPNDRGDITVDEDAAAIEDSLLNIFLTRKGERKFRPQFGTNLLDLKHSLMDENFGSQVKRTIQDGFNQEPRANLVQLDVEISQDTHEALLTIVWNAPVLIEEQKLTLLVSNK